MIAAMRTSYSSSIVVIQGKVKEGRGGGRGGNKAAANRSCYMMAARESFQSQGQRLVVPSPISRLVNTSSCVIKKIMCKIPR